MTAVQQQLTPEKKLITVASGKGGVGKTWFSVTLTQALAEQSERVLLFDGDLGLANVDIQLGLMPRYDIGHIINGAQDIGSAVTPFNDGARAGNGGFDILAGKSGSGALGAMSRERLLSVRSQLIQAANQYDRVVLDMAAGVDNSVLVLSQHRGIILVVMTPDPTSLTDAYAFIKMLTMRLPDADIRIVVNAASSQKEGERMYEAIRRACQGFLKISPPLAGVVKFDNKVRDAIRHQTPILTRHPNSVGGASVVELARGLRSGVPA
ncbi:flagellar biosynthesis protein FlhG [Rhodothalassium salexigens DSM 2132]|uniref:Flagellar biosynthesis protein FlhG n=1 Tax=Rhodothalassium salexigens DSM 2132 TaxID=1188247 RepID=A0A4R2PGF5_RHOSA|nr:P-loop NTPase [Rhodothalassium salexigens]MBB4211625.1 flagellar biosynthesis protein FlhG [Rhodothalassium salexigens DSM 2132]MBK1639089.1 cobyrinic acid a,c-diamide synthase [Rhodothalassium salexigens DSM 2132]TCP34443.1 flagellar biosynthesis protein FlhG [Rhodothalassium salexigens DSM 2132]